MVTNLKKRKKKKRKEKRKKRKEKKKKKNFKTIPVSFIYKSNQKIVVEEGKKKNGSEGKKLTSDFLSVRKEALTEKS